jgi:hypothetical protein
LQRISGDFALAGNLSLTGGGTVSGPVSGAVGTTIEFDGPSFSLGGSSSVTSAGAVGFVGKGQAVSIGGTYDVTGRTYFTGDPSSSSTVSFAAPITALGSDLALTDAVVHLTGQSFSLPTLEIIHDSELDGAGAASLTVTGSMTWDGGGVTGLGVLDIPSGATLNLGLINGGGGLDMGELKNAGTVTLATGTTSDELALSNGAGVDNEPGGSFVFQTDGSVSSDGSATYFINEGSLSGSSSQVIQPAFTQTASGTTFVQTGQLALQSTATNAGTVTIASGASLGVGTYTQTAGATVLNGGTINGGSLSSLPSN